MGLQDLTSQCHLVWKGSNLHRELYPFFKDLVDVGTACMGVSEGADKRPNYRAMDIFSIYFEEDGYGNPNYVYARYSWDAKQMINFFVKNFDNYDKIVEMLGEKVLMAYLKHEDTQFKFFHIVLPEGSGKKGFREFYIFEDPMDMKGMRNTINAPMGSWGSTQMMEIKTPVGMNNLYLNKGLNKGVISEKSIATNPYMVVRIRKQPGQLFGNGFSMEALPLILVLQQVQRMIMVGSHKNIEPPLNIPPSRRFQGNFSTNPNFNNTMDVIQGKPFGVQPAMPPVEIQSSVNVVNMLHQRLGFIFLNDLIQTGDYPLYKTATEVNKKASEEVKLLSPVIGSLETEFLKPLTEATIEHISRNSKDEDMQNLFEIIGGAEYGVQYISDIARAQSVREVNNLQELWVLKDAMSERYPEVSRVIDPVKFFLHTFILRKGFLPLITDPSKMKKEVDAMNKQMAEDRKMAQMTNLKDAGAGAKSFMEAEALRQGQLQGGQQ